MSRTGHPTTPLAGRCSPACCSCHLLCCSRPILHLCAWWWGVGIHPSCGQVWRQGCVCAPVGLVAGRADPDGCWAPQGLHLPGGEGCVVVKGHQPICHRTTGLEGRCSFGAAPDTGLCCSRRCCKPIVGSSASCCQGCGARGVCVCVPRVLVHDGADPTAPASDPRPILQSWMVCT